MIINLSSLIHLYTEWNEQPSKLILKERNRMHQGCNEHDAENECETGMHGNSMFVYRNDSSLPFRIRLYRMVQSW